MTRNMELKQFKIKSRKYDSETGIFEGYASVFGNVDSDGDIIEKGAFSKFLASDTSRVKILALHNEELLPIGRPLEMYEDDVGLYIKAQISDTAMGRDIRALLKDNVLDELSIGFLPHDFYFDADNHRHITEIELFEVSVVTWAANDMAKILDVKGIAKKSFDMGDLSKIAEILEDAAKSIKAFVGGSENISKSVKKYSIKNELKSRRKQ